jgi:nucleoside-diphosphate-sugar epimerase
MTSLQGQRVLVIGATGFIGGRLVERLLFEEGACVRAMVHSFSRAAYLGRLDVEMVQGDVADPRAMNEASVGCSVVVNCSYSNSGAVENDLAVNAGGVINVLDAAIANGVRRVVHISTASVMGPNPSDGADETFPCRPCGETYSDTKLEGERRALEQHQRAGSPVVIVRPTVVYGPRAPSWTLGPIGRLRSGHEMLVDGGHGLCNPVYIDNLVDGLLLAMTVEGIEGEVFILSDGVTVPWSEFIGYYADWVNAKPRSISFLRAEATASIIRLWEKMVGALVERVFADESEKIRRGAVAYSRQLLFDRMERESVWIKFFASRSRLSIHKARTRLGYNPKITLAEGMAITHAWAEQEGLI